MTDPQHRMAAAIAENVKAVIRHADANTPRSLQAEVGPSDYGNPCNRRLAYKTLDWPEINTTDPWKRIVGTAVHAWLEQTFGIDCQEKLPDGRDRYAVEVRVQADGAPAGKCDVLDRLLRCTIDWKIPGPTSLKNYARKNDPGDTYRRQQHTYGAGWVARGEQVDYVSIVFLPRNGDLKDMHVWAEPLDPAVVAHTVERWQGVISAVSTLQVEDHPERFALIAAEPSRLCGWCPYFRALSTDPANGCPGNTADLSANGLLMRPTRTSPSTTGTKETAA